MLIFDVACRVCVHLECSTLMIWPNFTYNSTYIAQRNPSDWSYFWYFIELRANICKDADYTSNNVSTLVILQLFLVNQIVDTASPSSLPLKTAVRDLYHKLIASIIEDSILLQDASQRLRQPWCRSCKA